MTDSATRKSAQISDDIQEVANNASRQIIASDKSRFLRDCIPSSLKLLLIVPVVALVAQLDAWNSGTPSGSPIILAIWCVLTVAVPIAWIVLRSAGNGTMVSRFRALRTADQQLGSSERIATADQFLSDQKQDGFSQAAIQDAAEWADRGREVDLHTKGQDHSHGSAFWWPVPIAMCLLMLAAYFGNLPRPLITAATENRIGAFDSENSVADQNPDVGARNPIEEEVEPKKDEPPSATNDKRQKALNRQGEANAAIPDMAEESRGKLDEGQTRESQQSANPSSAKGAPSASGQPSKSGVPKERKSNKTKKKVSKKERKKKPQKQDDKPSGQTAGQGSSKGSDNNAAPSDWSSKGQAATPEDENAEEEDEVDDEEEEQESRGGVQPNLRDRRTPVNRDLQIGFGSNRPNPDANGRGGPGGQKKSRGVASLVLGVPIPDRVNGQPNKGRIRITQQRITPEAEIADPTVAQDRLAREAPIGPVFHPDVQPWLTDYIRRYFLSKRAKHPLKSSESSTSSDTSLNTTQVTDSNTPQS